jgi:subfamily B ATP-binding cassette protein MsbA
MLMLISPIKHLSEVIGSVTRGLAAIERGLDVLDAVPDEAQGSHLATSVLGEVEFKNVSLTYPSATVPALKEVNLFIRAGQTVALVGASGSGKTSLANLLPRFLVPTSGQVLLDGVPLQDWQLANLRSHMAYVSQDVVMFNDSIANNIALGEAVETERLWNALKAANLADVVQALPHKEHTPVGHNATELSGGQRQRLAIARALYKNAAILILDEATSALDNASEQLVKDALQNLMQHRTSIVIAHRLSTIEHADVIVVMASGQVVEMGSHEALLQKGGAYAELQKSSHHALK